MNNIRVKDHAVSGEEFQLVFDEVLEMYKTEPQPSLEKLPSYYQSEDYISHTDTKRNLFEKIYHWVRTYMLSKKMALVDIHTKSDGKKILDIGCGTGDFLAMAQKYNWTIAGVEPDAEAREIATDEFFTAISQHIDAKSAKIRLRQALLYLDEAAILTIHGFCKRVLSQHAFASGVAFNAQMETNCQDLLLQACQDWYRVLAKDTPEQFKQVVQFWQNPLNFLSQFSKAINKHNELDVVNVDEIEEQFSELAKQAV